MKKIIVLSAAACLSVNAASFQALGYKSISMGGASVSNAKGDMAIYSNPALLGEKDDNFDTSFGAGLTARDGGAGQAVSDMEKLDFVNLATTLNDGTAINVSIDDVNKIKEARDIMVENDGSTISIRPHAHFSAQTLNFGIGVFSSSEMTAKMTMDTTHSQLILWQDTNGDGVKDNGDIYTNLEGTGFTTMDDLYNSTTGLLEVFGNSNMTEYMDNSLLELVNNKDKNYVDVLAVNITEIPVGYGKLYETKFGEIGVGGSLKFMTGATFSKRFLMDDASAVDTFADGYSITNTFGIDLGLTYKPNQYKNWVTGLVVKNINTPTFDVKTTDANGNAITTDYEVKPAARIGTSFSKDYWEVAADYDITENETFEGNEQFIGGGVLIKPWTGTSIRAGLKTNLADDKAGMIYTAGLGLGMKWVSLDIAGEIGSKEVTVNGATYREHMGVAVNLISRF